MKPEDVLRAPLQIKQGLTKSFIKAMDKSGVGTLYLTEKYPKISDDKIKEELIADIIFEQKWVH